MTPDTAVARLAEILSERSEFTEDQLYAAMTFAGLQDDVADLAYKFTQIAWGRVFLDGMGIEFAPKYFCFNRDGDVIESGLLSEQPYFKAAIGLATRQPPVWNPDFAIMSAEVASINSLMKEGSKPENLVTATPGLYMEKPTPAGMEKARQAMTKTLNTKAKKPWWRFW